MKTSPAILVLTIIAAAVLTGCSQQQTAAPPPAQPVIPASATLSNSAVSPAAMAQGMANDAAQAAAARAKMTAGKPQ
jgi:hypothetical protein